MWRWRGKIVGGCDPSGESCNGPEPAIGVDHQFFSTLLLKALYICQVAIATIAQISSLNGEGEGLVNPQEIPL
ncbi:hypothetical protein [Laspinema palackyanum]|uniref:hypothetical protein n=1 Tax=Laspinema palackyanum TaxID=3231601 RepID=UPI00345DBE69|nr:hypothetical protein [Laspinema sp. D2c]